MTYLPTIGSIYGVSNDRKTGRPTLHFITDQKVLKMHSSLPRGMISAKPPS